MPDDPSHVPPLRPRPRRPLPRDQAVVDAFLELLPALKNHTDREDRAACSEAQNICRYHAGFHAGEQYIRELLTTLATDSIALDHLQERHTDIEQQHIVTAAVEGPCRSHGLTRK
ncbi:hypothetical protein ACWDZ4_22090 [Streptomyces sp. NPDC003016]